MFTKNEVKEDIDIIVRNCLTDCITYALSDYSDVVSENEIANYFTEAVSDLVVEISENLN